MPSYTGGTRPNTTSLISSTAVNYSEDSSPTSNYSPDLRRRRLNNSNDGAPIERALLYLNNNSNFLNNDSEVDLFPLSPRLSHQSIHTRNRLIRRPRTHFSQSFLNPGVEGYWLSQIGSNERQTTEDTFISQINRISAHSLSSNMPVSSSQPASPSTIPKENTFFNGHSDHPSNDEVCGATMTETFDNFLRQRRSTYCNKSNDIDNHDTLKFKKKRKYSEIHEDYYKDLTLDKIKPQRCSFFKNGIKFKDKSKYSYSVSFLDINFDKMISNGYFQFQNTGDKFAWFNEHVLNKQISTSNKTTFLTFTGEIVDFSMFDLRYKTTLQQTFDGTIQQAGEVRSRDFHSAYQNCIVRKQLARWMSLEPFKNMTMKSLQSYITCEGCLETLQTKFILLRLYLKNSSIPDLLVCVNKEIGTIEMVSSESKDPVITQHMLYEREISRYEKNNNSISMQASPMRYSSASVGLS